ncbi:LAQU0S13e01530g1_1 [Lachancea quebecensis]|uniref:non-specific serine/threonine protein kinase n=1 Tax=Lachancea quebecensis TaxID=1654605 RepID=A0A0N7MM39_9SACH|nr:LAQU0S13e01530g1_1 [Lachancea quebecensis]
MNQSLNDIYQPGTELTVGSHRARIIKYLTSGGFAHIYTAEIYPADLSSPVKVACLKRVLVPDKPSLNVLRAEVDAMKLLRGNQHVVSYIDSHAAKSGAHDGSYEVFLLMEYCSNGGLIDFMNTRLQNRLQEAEVLKITSDITQGIAAMHALQPPLIHRDIKIENVLISDDRTFKVCDFGSVCGVIRPPKNPQEFNYVQHDILKNTTAQYRSPEMIDLYRGYPINEKSDIWALGVFLYKLCYYTTPFEKVGEAAILHSRFQYPSYPQYSDRLKHLISFMLSENPTQRPNICQVLEEVSRIQGVPCPLRNFYVTRAMQQQNQQSKVKLSHSTSQSKINSANNIINVPFKMNQNQPLRSTQTFAGAPVNATPNGYVPALKPFPIQPVSSNLSNGPFKFIEGSKALQGKQAPHFQSSIGHDFSKLGRSQTFTPTNTLSLRPSVSPPLAGRGDISKIISANPTNVEPSPVYLNSGTQTDDGFASNHSLKLERTKSISSLSSSESVESQHTGGSATRRLGQKLKKVFTGERRSISPIKSRQNTGDSVRSAFATLRRGFSGGSFKNELPNKRNSLDTSSASAHSNGYKFRVSSAESIEEENIYSRFSHSRSSSSASIVSDLDQLQQNDTGAKDYYKSHSPVKVSATQGSRSSIQKRVQDLLKNSQDSPVKKTAHGYGNFSPNDDAAELASQFTNETMLQNIHQSVATTPKVLSPAKRNSSVVIKNAEQISKGTDNTSSPRKSAPPKPQRPKKPSHLKADKIVKNVETSAYEHGVDISDIEIDELEKDFKRRYPSAV